MKVFSFCLFGTEPNYYEGLLENIKIIKEFYPDFTIFVYAGVRDPSWVLEGVTVIETGKEGLVNVLHRFLPLCEADVGFVRDTDSRIGIRDRWCIDQFLKSSYDYHIIRDHKWHKSPIMAGMFGWKKPFQFEFPRDISTWYGYEEVFLSETVYPSIKTRTLVHTNIHGKVGEHTERILQEGDFVGNVIWDGKPKFQYEFDIGEELNHLQQHDQFEVIRYLTDNIDPLSVKNREVVFDIAYRACFYTNDVAKAQYWLSQYEFCDTIPEFVVRSAEFLLQKMGRVIASFDPKREPGEGEAVIVYGNYPDWHHALPWTNKMFRNVSLFHSTRHAEVESHPCWKHVDVIYILNLEERADRYYETLVQLAMVHAPLQRIYHYKAKKDDRPIYLSASQNHVDVMNHFLRVGHTNALILEDDFVFLDDKVHIWNSIQRFFEQEIDYNICFLALSKYGPRVPYNDLLSKTRQICTTSSGYLITKKTAKIVHDVAEEGIRNMEATGDTHTNCIDRYWTKLDNLYFFKKKLGFQRPGYSNLQKGVVKFLD
jgi:hypothetical protein